VNRELQPRLPLKSLLCHTVTRGGSSATSTRLIPSLDVEFKRYHPEQFPKAGMGGFVQNTFFLHLFITSCEVTSKKSLKQK
jgi:hypothetical protein